ncbi:MAG: hypothetical protein SVO01_02945 [Thermotogota bacterium]|nr:hypothetical protein [Thermotogota bacterium]
MYACEEHKNSSNDCIVIHDYPKCPVCQLEKELDELYSEKEYWEEQVKERDDEIMELEKTIDNLKEEIKELNNET